MDYKEALDYINGVSWLGSKPGLERVRELPQAALGTESAGSRFRSFFRAVTGNQGRQVKYTS